MRLLSTSSSSPITRSFIADVTFTSTLPDADSRPEYAILSHTWLGSEDEVKLADLNDTRKAMRKPGWSKIDLARHKARKDGLEWIWIDASCIDQTSSAELSEAINAMYQWYQKSQVCYVYLADLKSEDYLKSNDSDVHLALLKSCRWFRRGWTLQEMIAPPALQFFGKDWSFIGDRVSLASLLEAITRVPIAKIGNLDAITAAEKMSWASGRETSRGEDIAYSLLGLFNVNLPLLYGEGSARAFQRLQEEILLRTRDLSLLLWKRYGRDDVKGILARTPNRFRDSSDIVSCSVYKEDLRDPFEVISAPFPQIRLTLPVVGRLAVFNFRLRNDRSGPIGLPISSHEDQRQLSEDRELAVRFLHSSTFHVVPVIDLQNASKRRLFATDHFNWLSMNMTENDLLIQVRPSSNAIEAYSSDFSLPQGLNSSDWIWNTKVSAWEIDGKKQLNPLRFTGLLFDFKLEFKHISAPGLPSHLLCRIRQIEKSKDQARYLQNFTPSTRSLESQMSFEQLSADLSLFDISDDDTDVESSDDHQWQWILSGGVFTLEGLSRDSGTFIENVKVSYQIHDQRNFKLFEFRVKHSLQDSMP